MLLFVNASLIVAIPCVWMLWAVLHGMGIGWSSSVLGRLRWRLIPAYTWLALAVLGAGIGLSVLLGVPVRRGRRDRARARGWAGCSSSSC